MLLLTCKQKNVVARCEITCEQEHSHINYFVKRRVYLLESTQELRNLKRDELYDLCHVGTSYEDRKDCLTRWARFGYFGFRIIDPTNYKVFYLLTQNLFKHFDEIK